MEVWFRKNPTRLDSEIKLLEEYGFNVSLDKELYEKNKIVLRCTLESKKSISFGVDDDLDLEIRYPDNYPYFRPEVYAFSLDLPRHQNPRDKNLCLIPRSTIFWDVDKNALQFLQNSLGKAVKKGVVIDQNEIGKDEDEQAEPISEYYLGNGNIIALSTRPKILVKDNPPLSSDDYDVLDHGTIKVNISSNSRNFEIYKQIIVEGKTKLSLNLDDPTNFLKIVICEWKDKEGKVIEEFANTAMAKSMSVLEFSWYKLSSITPFLKSDFNIELLVDKLKKCPAKTSVIITKHYKINLMALLFPEETQTGVMGWGWMLIGSLSPIKTRKRKINSPKIPVPIPIRSIDDTDYKARIPNSESLIGKTISVIGLGTLGAPSVIEFAKNGASVIKIMDYDFVEPGSSVRWPLGLEYVGQTKTNALKDFIESNYPHVEVVAINHKIGSVEYDSFPNENEVLSEFLRTDLVYDSTAEQGVNNFISDLCRDYNKPYIQLEGTQGAWGGIVMRKIPGDGMACWMCMRTMMFNNEIPKPPEDLSGKVQPRNCGDITFTGSSYDLQNIGQMGVKLAIDTLKDEKKLNWNVAVLSMVDKNDNSIPPLWEPLNLKATSDCQIHAEEGMDQY